MTEKRPPFQDAQQLSARSFGDANVLEARDGVALAAKANKSDCVKAGIKRLVQLHDQSGDAAHEHLGHLTEQALEQNDEMVLKALSSQGARPELTIDMIIDLAESDHAGWLVQILEQTDPGDIQDVDDPENDRRAFTKVMLQVLRRVCRDGYGRGEQRDFVGAVRDVMRGDYSNLSLRVHELGDIGDEQLMRYGVALSPTPEAARTIQERTGERLRGYRKEIKEAFRRGHDAAIRFIVSELNEDGPIDSDLFKNAVQETPVLSRTEHAGMDFHTSTIDEETALQIARHLDTHECRAVLARALNSYSYDNFAELIDRYDGRELIDMHVRGRITLPRTEYMVENLPVRLVYRYLNDLLGENPDRADELWERFVENRDREQILAMLGQAVRNRHDHVLERADDAVDMSEVPDKDKISNETMRERMPNELGQLLIETAIETMHPSLDHVYPEYGTFRDIDDEFLEGRWNSSMYTHLLDRAKKHDEDDHEDLRTRFGTRPTSAALTGEPDWERFDELVEHGVEVPDGKAFLNKVLEDGRRDLALNYLDSMESLTADTAYELVVHDDELFEKLLERYSFTNNTAVRAVNSLLTRTTHEDYLPDHDTRLRRLHRLDEAVDIDFDHDPDGADEIGKHPLQTIAGFAHRPDSDKRAKVRRAALGDAERMALIEALVRKGANPDRADVMEEALLYGDYGDVRALFEAGFTSVNEMSDPETIGMAREQALQAYLVGGGRTVARQEAFAEGVARKLNGKDWGSPRIARSVFGPGDDLSTEQRIELYENAPDEPHDRSLAMILGEITRRTHRPPPQEIVEAIPDGVVRRAIKENMNARQRKALNQTRTKRQT